MLDAALICAEYGVPVFQVWHADDGRCGCRAPDCASPAKHPIASTAPNGFKNATTDAAIIRRWFGLFPPHANIAEATGHYSVVLDIDADKGGRETLARLEAEHGPLPLTATVLTGGGGEHRRFRPVPGLRCNSGRVGPGLDIRAEDGYALLPPSNHVSGGTYVDDHAAPMFETPLAEMPAWLVERAIAPQGAHGGNGHTSPVEWAARLQGAPEGQRRDVALQIAGHYLGLHIAPPEVETILVGYAARCVPPFPENEARELVRDLARRDRARAPASAASAVKPPPRSGESDGPVVVCLGDVAPESVSWLWPTRIARGKLALLIGEPGTGKTYVIMDLAARTTRGADWPDGNPGAPGRVVILTGEDGIADTVRPRVDRQGGDPTQVFVLRGVRVDGVECPFSLERDLLALEQTLATTGAALVIIDPLSAYLGSKDSHKDSEIRRILSPLAALAERLGVAILGVMHLTKAAQRRLLHRAQGSVAFVAAARTVFAVGEDPDTPDRRLLVAIKSNLGPMPPALGFRIGASGLAWEATSIDGTAERLLAMDEPASRAESRARDTAATFLRDLLRDGPVASRQVEADAKANGISQRTLWRAKEELGILAERGKAQDGRAGAWYWILPPSEPR